MKKILIFIIPIFALLTIWPVFVHSKPAHAAAFVSTDLIDDSVFNNTSAMAIPQINNWLSANFPSSCISQSNGFSAPDPTGYSPSSGFTYGAPVSAGQVIYDAALAYGLNPQVLITTLQKEEGLIKGDGPYGCTALSMSAALGYGCTDSGTNSHSYTYTNGTDPGTLPTPLYYTSGTPVNSVSNTCVNSNLKAGFSEQMIHAAWLLKFGQQRSEGNTSWDVQYTNFPQPGDRWNNADDPQTCYGGPMTQGSFKRCSSDVNPVFYDGYITIDGVSTHMDTGATAALYWYTPHFHGNQNFDSIFQSWFGSTIGPFYQFSSAVNPPSSLEYGHSASVQVKLINSSSMTWYSDGNLPAGTHPFRLMTRGYQNSQFADTQDPAWLGTQNQIRMVEASVAPGQTATFNFSVRAPTYSVSYDELNMVLVQDGIQVYQDLGLQFRLSSVPDYAYTVNSLIAPADGILPGDMYRVTVQLKNTGAETWYSDGNVPAGKHPIRLATPYYKNSPYAQPGIDPAWLGTQNQIRMVEASVAPGQYATFQTIFTGPYQAINNYVHNFELVLDGVRFIWGPVMPLVLSTPAPIATYSFVSATNPPASMQTGNQATTYIKVRNTGNMIWRSFNYKVLSYDGSRVLLGDTRMITSAPSYRNSLFAVPSNADWLGTQNQARMQEVVVAPGQVGTFEVVMQAPATTGHYLEYFNFAIDGFAIMPDLGLAYPITVTP